MAKTKLKSLFKGGNLPEMPNNPEEALKVGMELAKDPKIWIIGGVFLIIIIIIIVVVVTKSKSNGGTKLLISHPIKASKPQMISNSELPVPTSHEFSMNFWIFIRDWSMNYGKPKCVLYKGDPNCNRASPMVFLYPNTNSLMVRFAMPDRKRSMNPFKCGPPNPFNPIHSCDVTNIPLQRWVQVSIVLWNTTSDVYINGKLARSCTYQSVPSMMNDSNIYIAQGGGFNGYISKLSYYGYAIDALKAYQLYMKGPLPKKFLGISSPKTSLCGSSSSSSDDPDDDSGSSTNTQPDSDAFTHSEDSMCHSSS